MVAAIRRILEKDVVLSGFLVPAEVCDITDCNSLNFCCVIWCYINS